MQTSTNKRCWFDEHIGYLPNSCKLYLSQFNSESEFSKAFIEHVGEDFVLNSKKISLGEAVDLIQEKNINEIQQI